MFPFNICFIYYFSAILKFDTSQLSEEKLRQIYENVSMYVFVIWLKHMHCEYITPHRKAYNFVDERWVNLMKNKNMIDS